MRDGAPGDVAKLKEARVLVPGNPMLKADFKAWEGEGEGMGVGSGPDPRFRLQKSQSKTSPRSWASALGERGGGKRGVTFTRETRPRRIPSIDWCLHES